MGCSERPLCIARSRAVREQRRSSAKGEIPEDWSGAEGTGLASPEVGRFESPAKAGPPLAEVPPTILEDRSWKRDARTPALQVDRTGRKYRPPFWKLDVGCWRRECRLRPHCKG